MELYKTLKVSVIIPVYNVEQYLDECIGSCVNQTWRNIQIILVDDGSTDNSASICDAWAEKDERILVIHKQNEGVSKARNTGLEHAEGELICFVDGDDIAGVRMIETAIERMKPDVDLVMWGYQTIRQDGEISERKLPNCQSVQFHTHKERAWYTAKSFFSYDYSWAVWNRMYRKDKLDRYMIRFPEQILLAEDLYFNFCYLTNLSTIVFIPESIYFYRIRSDSAMSFAQLKTDMRRTIRLAQCIKQYLINSVDYADETKLFPLYLYRLLENEHERVSTIPLTDYPKLREEIGERTVELEFFNEQMEAITNKQEELRALFGRIKALRIMNLVAYIRTGNLFRYRIHKWMIKWYSRLWFWLRPKNWLYKAES